MLNKIILIICLLVVSCSVGCVRTTFVKNGATVQDFNRDKYQCQMDAAQYVTNLGFGGNYIMIAQETNTCLQLKYGWRVQ